MSNRERFVFYLDEQDAAEWKAWIREHYGKLDQHKSEAARLAIRELMAADDDDDLDGVHEKLDAVLARLPDEEATHTHKQSAADDLDRMVDKICAQSGPVKDHEVDDIIIDVRGLAKGDTRTLTTWKDRLRKSGDVYDSPLAPLWFDDPGPWISAVEDVETARAETNIEAHGLTLDEYDRLCTDYAQSGGDDADESDDTADSTQSVHTATTDDGEKTVHSPSESDVSDKDYAQSVHSDVDDELAAIEAADPARANGHAED